MPWVTPPTFVNGDELFAAMGNTISGDLAYLKSALDALGTQPAVEFKTGTTSFNVVTGGVWIVTASVTFAAGADLNHRISLNIGGNRTQKSLGGGVTTQLSVMGAGRLTAGTVVQCTSDGAGTVNSQRIAGVRIGP